MRNFKWLVLAAVLTAGPVSADEGMWTFDNFPSAAVAKKFNVQIDGKWLNRVQESIVRLSNCTATYVSADGLILTNHHCAAECLADNSTPEHSLIETGFLAADRSQEKKCGTQIADTLVAMENITDKVNAATHGMDAKKANETRKRTLTALEQGCEEASKKDAEYKKKQAPPDPWSEEEFKRRDAEVYDLRVAVLGAEGAAQRSPEDGKRSPVEIY